jgi:hypothetical protein
LSFGILLPVSARSATLREILVMEPIEVTAHFGLERMKDRTTRMVNKLPEHPSPSEGTE